MQGCSTFHLLGVGLPCRKSTQSGTSVFRADEIEKVIEAIEARSTLDESLRHVTESL
jgi:hypothetical protein